MRSVLSDNRSATVSCDRAEKKSETF